MGVAYSGQPVVGVHPPAEQVHTRMTERQADYLTLAGVALVLVVLVIAVALVWPW